MNGENESKEENEENMRREKKKKKSFCCPTSQRDWSPPKESASFNLLARTVDVLRDSGTLFFSLIGGKVIYSLGL